MPENSFRSGGGPDNHRFFAASGFNFLGVLIYGSIPFLKFGVLRKALFVLCDHGSVFLSRTLMAGSFADSTSAHAEKLSTQPKIPAQPQPVTHDF